MGGIRDDLQYALRSLLRNPTSTLIIAGTLALGMGLAMAMFVLVNAVLIRPLPYDSPEELVALELNAFSPIYSKAEVVALRTVSALDGVEGYGFETGILRGDEATRLRVGRATSGLFGLLGVTPVRGRAFLAEDGMPDAPRVAMLTHSRWMTSYGGESGVVGRTVSIDGRDGLHAYTIVGILPMEVASPLSETDFWYPVAVNPSDSEDFQAKRASLRTIARLRDGVVPERAQAEVTALVKTFPERFPLPYSYMNARRLAAYQEKHDARVVPFKESLVGSTRGILVTCLGFVLFVLLIAAANVANIQLARSLTRQKEMSVRFAVGGRRSRLVRTVFMEMALTCVLGGAGGLLIAYWGRDFLLGGLPLEIPAVGGLSLDLTVLGFVLLTIVGVSGLIGLAPALLVSERWLNGALRSGAGSAGGSRQANRARQIIVVGATALAVVLTTGAGLMLRSFWLLRDQDPGFRTEGAFVFDIDLRRGTPEEYAGFYRDLLDRVDALPGVSEVAAVAPLPLSGAASHTNVGFVDHPTLGADQRPIVQSVTVTPGYFRVMGIPLLSGREFTSEDVPGNRVAVMVNQTFARRFWPGEDPVGKVLDEGQIVVGLVEDVLHDGLSEEVPAQLFSSAWQRPRSSFSLVVRSELGPSQMVGPIRAGVRAMDPGVPVYGVRSLASIVDGSVMDRTRLLQLLWLLATLGVMLSALGLYGVMSGWVEDRRREIGIRRALGADSSKLAAGVIRRGALLAGCGVVLGLGVAVAATRALRAYLFEISPTDPRTLCGVALTLLAVAAIASAAPAWRAVRADPVEVLREE
jgi:putative ABC transport system permease protein